ncbi:Peptidoglycan-binding domain 1 protein [Geobacter metallireducens RCH3]|uniref:Peptidoglycan-binding ATPase, putative n=1 Tax=Geobacter metallireducens (strain ATCC 53774 / DSM 7210 / GS-15) TaxID=269799 RepID=Q39ST3_GEOMG|nr:AAA family ATPase [Geobacter metallireducens]ABB32691.1 peptidoglycan-binding ATPase, putative [Geobacter metallireducens GS-15]EHP87816.1 Peptidoglycan-binding domain 1 protein [Geobacter metallireducens RCH3]
MYCDHFGFSEHPFALTPNPAFLFLSSRHQEAFAHLLYGIDTRAGFIELSGEVGTGKTTVIRTFLNQLDPETHRTALVFNPTVSPLGLLQGIIREFGLPGTSTEKSELLETLNRFLLDENRAGHTVVLVIDEAQNLSPEVLEQIRLISNLETERDKLIQIVLVGQPELRHLLARQELRQLDQRITVRYHLEPMGLDDTKNYIRHRIRIAAGGREPVIFSAGAVKKIFGFSGGLPRLINAACDRALLLAYTTEAREVSPAMAAAAIADVATEARPPSPSRRFAVAAALILVAALGAGTFAVTRKGGESLPSASPPPTEPAASGEQPLKRTAALAGLAAVPEKDNLSAAVNTILRSWQAPPVASSPSPADLRSLARERGLTVTELSGTLNDLARLDTPALLHITLPQGGKRLVALTSLDKGHIGIDPPIAGHSTLTGGELSTLWSGRASVIWKNFHGIPSRLKPGGRSKAVGQLQELLKGAGYYAGRISGTYDTVTQEAIRSFQTAEGLDADGRTGEKTLLLLYRRAGGFFPPGLTQGKTAARTEAGDRSRGKVAQTRSNGEQSR